MARLTLNESLARTVIEVSEGAQGYGGGHRGHTKERHINISRDDLWDRMSEPDPQGRYNGKTYWRSAFLDIHSCTALLVRTIHVLQGHKFVWNFANVPDGTIFPTTPEDSRAIFLDQFACRDCRGRSWSSHVRIYMQKNPTSPCKLHLITFYPFNPGQDNWSDTIGYPASVPRPPIAADTT